jgi:hypothetical protein
MDENKYFKIIVERRVPFFTNTFTGILSCCLFFFVIVYLIFYPFKYLSPEMQFLVYLYYIPKLLAQAIYYAFIIGIGSYILVVYIRLHKKAVLSCSDDSLTIRGKALRFSIPIKSISDIDWAEIKNIEGVLKKIKLRIVERNDNVTRFTLMNYDSEADDLMNQLILYGDAFKINFYDFDTGPDIEDDEEKNTA